MESMLVMGAEPDELGILLEGSRSAGLRKRWRFLVSTAMNRKQRHNGEEDGSVVYEELYFATQGYIWKVMHRLIRKF